MPPERHLTSPTAPTAKNKTLVSFAFNMRVTPRKNKHSREALDAASSVGETTGEEQQFREKAALAPSLLSKQVEPRCNSEKFLIFPVLSKKNGGAIQRTGLMVFTLKRLDQKNLQVGTNSENGGSLNLEPCLEQQTIGSRPISS
jgi:hypothetical protein